MSARTSSTEHLNLRKKTSNTSLGPREIPQTKTSELRKQKIAMMKAGNVSVKPAAARRESAVKAKPKTQKTGKTGDAADKTVSSQGSNFVSNIAVRSVGYVKPKVTKKIPTNSPKSEGHLEKVTTSINKPKSEETKTAKEEVDKTVSIQGSSFVSDISVNKLKPKETKKVTQKIPVKLSKANQQNTEKVKEEVKKNVSSQASRFVPNISDNQLKQKETKSTIQKVVANTTGSKQQKPGKIKVFDKATSSKLSAASSQTLKETSKKYRSPLKTQLRTEARAKSRKVLATETRALEATEGGDPKLTMSTQIPLERVPKNAAEMNHVQRFLAAAKLDLQPGPETPGRSSQKRSASSDETEDQFFTPFNPRTSKKRRDVEVPRTPALASTPVLPKVNEEAGSNQLESPGEEVNVNSNAEKDANKWPSCLVM